MHHVLVSLAAVLMVYSSVTSCYRLSSLSLLNKKVSQLKNISRENILIELDSQTFYNYIVNNPKNYSFVVAFTSNTGKFFDSMDVVQELRLVAKSWMVMYPESSQLFFGVLNIDFSNDVNSYSSVDDPPEIVLYTQLGKKTVQAVMHISGREISAEAIAQWLSGKLHTHINIINEVTEDSWSHLVLQYSGILLLVIVRRHFIWELTHDATKMAIVALLFCAVMTSGQMWNYINSPPLYGYDGYDVEVFIDDNTAQYVGESIIFFFLVTSATFGFIGITEAAKKPGSRDRNNYEAIIGVGIVVVSCLYILSSVSYKEEGYPYIIQMY